MTGIAKNQNAIRDCIGLTACMTIDQLDEALPDIKRGEIVKSTGKLIFKGYVERVEIGCYQLTKEGQVSQLSGEVLTSGPYRPHTAKARKRLPDTLRQRAWNSMRMGGSFTIPDIMAIVSTLDAKDSKSNLQRYCRALVKTGYLIELPVRTKGTKAGSNGFKRYRLINDVGEYAPVWQPAKGTMFDHNAEGEQPCK